MNIKQYLTDLHITNLQKLNGFHNIIYQGKFKGKDIIIRISERRNQEDILAEIYVLLSIKDQVSIAAPVKVNEEYVIKEGQYVLSFYEKVDAKNWYETTLTNDTHFRTGKELGKLHLALMKLQNVKKKSFQEHPDIELLKETNPLVLKTWHNLLEKLKNHKDSSSFGLIHGDYLFSNILYHQDHVTIIDFDDLEYNYYLYDVAVYLFYLLLGGDPSNIDVSANIEVFIHFIKGYRSINRSTTLDFSMIQQMFLLRQLKLYATITTKMDASKFGDWQKNYIKLCEKQFSKNMQFVDIPYENIYQKLEFNE